MVAFSEILKRLIVHPILACRLGGDEFALLSHDVVTLRSLCEACRIEFARHCDRTYQDALSEPRPRVSAGLTALSADLSTSLRTADVALYRAKTEGRNRLYEWSEAQALVTTSDGGDDCRNCRPCEPLRGCMGGR